MKKVTLIFTLLITAICFAQNESSGTISTTITTPSPLSGEIFRFDSGIVTQLDSGVSFDFDSRWFSLGRLNTGTQNVYGLRFQLPDRAITMGYQDLGDANPRVQWIGESSFSGTDLEFRAANSFSSTSSTLVATMTNDGKTFFGNPLSAIEAKVGIDYGDVGSTRTGLIVDNVSTANAYIATGFKSINNVGGYRKIGLDVSGTSTSGAAYDNIGVNIRLNGASVNRGVNASVTGSSTGTTYGVAGFIYGPSGTTPTGLGAAVYGSSATTSNRYAGYFNGNVFTTGLYLSSDKKLKTDIEDEKNILNKLAQLDAVNYTYKVNDQLNLPQGLQHGFIAQNIEEVFPELVTTIKKPIFDKDNKEVDVYEYKAVNYIGMISILTSSLKELNETSTARINELTETSTARINELNEKVEALENVIENIRDQVESNGETKLDNLNDAEEMGFLMEQNKPNPFTDQTVVNYTLPNNAKATIAVVDLSGKFIREYDLSRQKGQLTINSSDIGKGIFIYTLISDNEVMISKKMIVR
ncbi:tail fiber domain-containing protein [Kordia sp. YSTF-M3]|uniref:Tail fiber domain-containing protein n=1 Tax=Kordia aestuariivivens TaxID=2759037 RepID=A0ABR7Q3S6_9FLAO|nr:tail fiber domain-containing protein [Kordia aestuariivivens]MBC8753205.1 tail fiber domain-containing protein [Kordia aestuariivivens]